MMNTTNAIELAKESKRKRDEMTTYLITKGYTLKECEGLTYTILEWLYKKYNGGK